MAKQKKVLDVDTGRMHLVCIMTMEKSFPLYRIYSVTSVPGAGSRKKLLVKYNDFISVLSFMKDFYLDGVDAMLYQDIVKWIQERSL